MTLILSTVYYQQAQGLRAYEPGRGAPGIVEGPDVFPRNVRDSRETFALGRRLHLGHRNLEVRHGQRQGPELRLSEGLCATQETTCVRPDLVPVALLQHAEDAVDLGGGGGGCQDWPSYATGSTILLGVLYY